MSVVPLRSMLFIPGDSEKKLGKVDDCGADAVILDLEDAVAPENKPLARMMFKYGKVGSEIPAQLYAAVAEILAYVYRINRFRYYAEQNQA